MEADRVAVDDRELPSALDGVLDRGLERAFGEKGPKDDPKASPSVIQRIGEITGPRPSVSLPEPERAAWQVVWASINAALK